MTPHRPIAFGSALSLLVVLLSTAPLAPTPVGAQALAPTPESASLRAPAMTLDSVREAAAALPAAERAHSFWRPVAVVLGGAALGGWIGYFASQVRVSDWSDATSHRAVWALGGAGVGAVGGLVLSSVLGERLFGTPATGTPRRPAAGRVIGAEEIRGTQAVTLYEALQILVPNWLNDRGQDKFSNDLGVLIYVNGDEAAGGVSALHDIAASVVTSVERLTPGEATYRFGAGHNDGALLVSTR